MTSKVYGFIGCGNMAQALIRGMIAKKLTVPENVYCSSPKSDIAILEKVGRLGCRTTTKNCKVADGSNILVVAVKPLVTHVVLKEIASLITPEHLVISIVTGITTKVIEEMLPPNTRVIRAMPNTPSLVCEGVSVISLGSATLDDDRSTALKMFRSVGICEAMQEQMLDAVTGLVGGGPAYMYMVLEALADGGVKMGISRDLALKFATQTMLGSARMVMETGLHPGNLKDKVCSPGGTTIEAVHQLEKSCFRSALISAVEAATFKAIKIREQKEVS